MSLLDKTFRLNNLYKVIDTNANFVSFQLNAAQRYFHEHKALRNIFLKSRRLGFTTYSAIDMLDNTLFVPNFTSYFRSYDDDSSAEVFDKLILFNWLHFPQFLKEKYDVDTSNAKTLKVNFGDNIFSQIMVKSSGRGSGLNHVHVSELGKIANKWPEKADEIMSGTIPALTHNGFLTIESTAEGEDNLFHELFIDAYENPTAYLQNPKALKPFFFNWQWDKSEISKIKQPDSALPKEFLDYQKKHNELAKKHPQLYNPINDIQLTFWYQKFVESGKRWSRLLENFPTTPEEAFTSSGHKVFTTESYEAQLPFIQDPIDTSGAWQFFQMPNPRHQYVIGVDPSEGVGRDHSAIIILDVSSTKYEVVAIYKNNIIDPDVLAFEIRNKAILYNTPLVIVERNNTGHATLTRLKDIYPVEKIYTERKEEYEESHETDKLGFSSNSKTKGDIIFNLKSLLEAVSIIIFSKSLLTEIKMYGLKNLRETKTTEDTTNHFDLLISLALACHAARFIDRSDDEFEIIIPKQIHDPMARFAGV